VKVHPEQADEIRSHIESFKLSFPGIEQIEVITEPHIARDACIIESDIGRVEASMSGQIEALRSTFERVFSASRASKSNGQNNGLSEDGTAPSSPLPNGSPDQEE
jgi:type III secretion protein L